MDSIKEIKLAYKPYEKQQQVHKLCDTKKGRSGYQSDEKAFFIMVISGRQSGKTKLAINQIVKWALENPMSKCWWVAPAEKHCIDAYKSILNGNGSGGLYAQGLVKSHRGSSGAFEIILVNDSIIEFKSAGSAQNLRGSSVNFMVIDEAREIEKSIMEEVLIPTLNVKGRKCLICSTPRGKSHWTFDYYTKGLKGNEQRSWSPNRLSIMKENWQRFRSFHFTSADNPYAIQENIDMAKSLLPEMAFKQEYLAEFVDKGQVFRNIDELSILETVQKNTYGVGTFCGIDIGLRNDASVITIMDSNYNVLAIERLVGITAPELKQRIKDFTTQYSCRKVLIESNNQGRPIIDDLKDTYGIYKMTNIEEFITSNSSKELLISQLVNAFEEKKIKILKKDQPNGDTLNYELNAFGFDFTPTGKVVFRAMGSAHDDTVVSLALAMRCVNGYQYRSLSFA